MYSAAEERHDNEAQRPKDLPVLSVVQDVQRFCDEVGKGSYDTVVFVPMEFSEWQGGGMVFDPQYSDTYADGKPVSICTQYLAFLSSRQDNPSSQRKLEVDIRYGDRVLYLFRRPQNEYPRGFGRLRKRQPHTPSQLFGGTKNLPPHKAYDQLTLGELGLVPPEEGPVHVMIMNAADYGHTAPRRREWEAEEVDYEDMSFAAQLGMLDDDNTIEVGPFDTMSTLRATLSEFTGIPVDYLLIIGEDEEDEGEVTNWRELFLDMEWNPPNYEVRVNVYDRRRR